MSQAIPDTGPEFDGTRIIERPDGFYWQTLSGNREFGPFPTLIEAVEDMRLLEDDELEVGESLLEAEDEIGIAGWVDPDTGELAEDYVPRLEDH